MKVLLKKIIDTPILKTLIISMIAVAYLELFIRGDVLNTIIWIWTHPHMLLMNGIAVMGIVLLIHSLVNRWRVTATCSMILIYLYGMINSVKFKTLGQYFYPWDSGFVSELGGVTKNLVNLDFSKPLLFLVLGIVLLIYFLRRDNYKGSDLKLKAVQRAIALGLAVISVGALVYHKEWSLDSGLEVLGVQNYAWAPVQSYQSNGSVLAYLINTRMNVVEKPENYSKEQIAAVVEDISAEYTADNKARTGQTEVKPNIIVVMSEALWDPNQLTKIQFSQDPMKNLNKAKKSSFVSPTFGGYTSNVEFEFLTGMTMMFLPPSSVPYQHFIKKSMPSLPSELKKNGYATVAVHPYHPWFWERDKVYPLLGFDEFIAEDGFADAKTKGYYISDESVMDKVIGKIESTEEPLFLFAVTMQNHGPYDDDRYNGTELQITGQDPAMKEQILDTYSQGVLDADRAFKKLTDYVDDSDEPTLVIEFGDHLPSLGENFEMYHKYGYIREGVTSYEDMTPDEQLKIRSTQLSAYSNDKDLILPGYVSPSMLSARILDYSGSEMGDYYRLLFGLSNTFTCIYGQNIIDNNGVMAQMNTKTAKEYWQLQYDLLVGKQYFNEIEAAKERENAPILGLKQ